MKQYLDLMRHVLNTGVEKIDRTGTGTLDVFGYQTRYDLREGFPLVTTKKIHWKSVVGELLWFLEGSSDNNRLRDHYGVTIWDEWAPENGDLGAIYGVQWRSWPAFNHYHNDGELSVGGIKYIDQIQEVINQIKTNPLSRRLIVSAWNVGQLDQMALPPCHLLFQFNCEPIPLIERLQMISKDGWDEEKAATEDWEFHDMLNVRNIPRYYLDVQLFQRSADTFLGVPFNIASYALLLMMIAQVTGTAPRHFIHSIGSAHIYKNHLIQSELQLTREPRQLPTVALNPDITDITKFTPEDIFLLEYNPWPLIKAPVSI